MHKPDTSPRTIVVTGGAGYIGTSTCHVLAQAGYRPVILDNFCTSPRDPKPAFPFHEVDLSDRTALQRAWANLSRPTAVIHFAARALVGESCERPELYFRNNILATVNIAECAADAGVPLVHSSSCAVYGHPDRLPITEDSPLRPISPYGESKRISESILESLGRYRGLRFLNLRYFNPAGSTGGGRFGETHDPETHLIPLVVRAALEGTPVAVYGEDYETPDGTCVRDFIHVEDLAEAHATAVEAMLSGASLAPSLNLGSGQGYSVREVIAAAEAAFGTPVPTRTEGRRPGDPPRLVADISRARRLLKWQPRRGLAEMLESHRQWLSRRG